MTHKPQRCKVRVRFSTLDEDEGGPGRLALSFSLSLSAWPNLGLNESVEHYFTLVNQSPLPQKKKHSFPTPALLICISGVSSDNMGMKPLGLK